MVVIGQYLLGIEGMYEMLFNECGERESMDVMINRLMSRESYTRKNFVSCCWPLTWGRSFRRHVLFCVFVFLLAFVGESDTRGRFCPFPAGFCLVSFVTLLTFGLLTFDFSSPWPDPCVTSVVLCIFSWSFRVSATRLVTHTSLFVFFPAWTTVLLQ